MIQDPPGPSGRSPATAALWTLLLAAVFFFSVLALLQIRAGAYDESFLLLGARLVRSGELPYVDFYTHYGPLGYTIVAAWSAISRNPGLALRSLQAVLLGAVLLLLVAAGRKKQVAGQRLLGFGGIAFGAFAVANVFRSGAFLGFALLMTALLMLVISQTSSSATAASFSALRATRIKS